MTVEEGLHTAAYHAAVLRIIAACGRAAPFFPARTIAQTSAVTPLDFRSVTQAALDVAIERLTALHPEKQLFIFGEKGEPFWARFEPSHAELEVLKRALSVLEEAEHRPPAPLTVRGASGQFTAMVLDAERSWFAVVLMSPVRRLPSERRAPQGQLRA
jgi:hypothetical protein